MNIKVPKNESEIKTLCFGSVNELIDSFHQATSVGTYDTLLAFYILIWFGIPAEDTHLIKKEHVTFGEDGVTITIDNGKDAPWDVAIRNPQAVHELKKYMDARYYRDKEGGLQWYQGDTFLRSSRGALGDNWMPRVQKFLNKSLCDGKKFYSWDILFSTKCAKVYAQFCHCGIEITEMRVGGADLLKIAPAVDTNYKAARTWIASYWDIFYLWCQIYRK